MNGAYIDVRIYFSDDEISVPKFHFDLDILPAAYMFIKLNSDLSNYEVTGFIRPEYIDKNNEKDGYYYVDKNYLISLYDIESHFVQVPDTFNGDKEILYSFVDESITENSIAELLRLLVSSANARTTLIKAFKAKSVFKLVSAANVHDITTKEHNNDNSDLSEQDDLTESDLDEIFADENSEHQAETPIDNSDELYNALEYSTEVTPSNQVLEEEQEENPANEEQIDSLFTGEQEGVPVGKKKKSSPFLVIVLLLTILCAGGYYAYTNYFHQNQELPQSPLTQSDNENVSAVEPVPSPVQQQEDAMPNETVNVSNNAAATEEASSVAIPAIEQHLDASVLVSNLKVDWEVPAGYASNTSAKRYLVKLGKIIQLNLKSELLLLNKPPISNKISVELKYNTGTDKFEIVGINDSSGEKSVDDVILNTIRSALSMSNSSNIESFGKLQGNPVLIIHL